MFRCARRPSRARPCAEKIVTASAQCLSESADRERHQVAHELLRRRVQTKGSSRRPCLARSDPREPTFRLPQEEIPAVRSGIQGAGVVERPRLTPVVLPWARRRTPRWPPSPSRSADRHHRAARPGEAHLPDRRARRSPRASRRVAAPAGRWTGAPGSMLYRHYEQLANDMKQRPSSSHQLVRENRSCWTSTRPTTHT